MRQWALLVLASVLLACQEDLAAPADCPALCPGGSPQVFEELLTPILHTDSSFRGYVKPSAAPAILASNGLQGSEERAILRFSARPDSIEIRDTLRAITIDSVALGFTVLARDTNLDGLQLQVYRLPVSIDSNTTYGDVDPAFTPTNLVATIPVPDTLNEGLVRTVLQGPDLGRIQIPPADSGVLAVGVRAEAPAPTGVRLGSTVGAAPATFVTYATLDVPDTGAARLRTLSLEPVFNSTVSPVPPVDDPVLLPLGGAPSARALLRFDLPPVLDDSATIVRATLELTPTSPIGGLPTDPPVFQARTVLADLGAKSPVSPVVGRITDTLEIGAAQVTMELAPLVELWQGETTRPSALVLSVGTELEGASFSQPVFYSTRAADPAVWPRLRVSYLRSFPFENY